MRSMAALDAEQAAQRRRTEEDYGKMEVDAEFTAEEVAHLRAMEEAHQQQAAQLEQVGTENRTKATAWTGLPSVPCRQDADDEVTESGILLHDQCTATRTGSAVDTYQIQEPNDGKGPDKDAPKRQPYVGRVIFDGLSRSFRLAEFGPIPPDAAALLVDSI